MESQRKKLKAKIFNDYYFVIIIYIIYVRKHEINPPLKNAEYVQVYITLSISE